MKHFVRLATVKMTTYDHPEDPDDWSSSRTRVYSDLCEGKFVAPD